MLDEQQDAPDPDEVPKGAVSAEQLMNIPGPPSPENTTQEGSDS